MSLRAGAVLALICGMVACGSSEPDRPERVQPQRLTAVERAAAEAGYDAIRTYCRRLGLRLTGRRATPGRAAQRRAVAGARRIASLARRKPEALYSEGQTARQLAGDTAEDLEGTNCSARLVAELARGL
ncbi:MAG: hypothetical protein ACRDLQ_02735 [Solirubrobacterales bacterium]